MYVALSFYAAADNIFYRRNEMTAIKRCCALALAVLMILTALPVTAFAQAAEQEVNASLQETTVSGIANDIAR